MKTGRLISLFAISMSLTLVSCVHQINESFVARVLKATESHDIYIGDVINVETRRLEYEGQYQDVLGVIIDPDGNSYQGRSFTVNEAGLYQVKYQAYFGHHLEEQHIDYLCKRKCKDLFTITNPVDISYGEYRHNTSDYHHEGVLIDVKNGSEVLFNMPLSINDFMEEQKITYDGKGFKDRSVGAYAHSLIDFLVDPSTLMSTDFTSMTIRLTDSIDKTNYVDIRIDDALYNASYESGSMSYVRAGASCNWQLGWEWEEREGNQNLGKFHNGQGGTGLNLSYRGQQYNDTILSAQILYCAKNSRFYSYRGSLETVHTYFINDLSDPVVYGNNAWGGFESGEFYLSIIPSSFSNSTGRLLIKSVGKYLLSSDVLEDNEAPIINVDTLGYDSRALPRAVVGKKYSIFNATVEDFYDFNLDYDVSVTYRDSTNKKDIDVSIEDNAFMVNKAGAYTITYKAKDRSGNIADTISLKVLTVDTFEDVVLDLAPLPSEVTVDAYDLVEIPKCEQVTTSGGVTNSKIDVTREVFSPTGFKIDVTGDEFRPTMVGDYKVVFKGKDYVGNVGEVIYTIHSQELSKPIFLTEKPNLPKALIKGFKYQFDNIEAIETDEGLVKEVEPTILINGEEYTGQYIASGTNATVTFEARGKSGTSSKSVDLPVIDVKNEDGGYYHSRYFIGDYSAIESIYNEKNNVTLSGSVDGYSSFIKELNPNAFELNLRLIEDYTNMDVISVKFTDSKDCNVNITFDIDLNEQKITAPYLPQLDFSLNEDAVGLSYDDKSKVFKDTLQNQLGTLIKDDNGNDFTGFKGGIYLSIGLKGVHAESKIAVENICVQPLGNKNKGKDRIPPSIRYNGYIISEQQKDDLFVYPTFDAFDVLSDIKETSITIIKPDGTTITGDKDMTETFRIEQVGDYYIHYVATDTSNYTKEVDELVSVYDDVKPTITVNNPPMQSYSLNSSLTIPSYTAYDESGKYTVDVILILPTNEMRILTHHVHDEEEEEVDVIEYAMDSEHDLYDPSFIVDKTTCRLQMVGNYRLRFVVYDKAYNMASIEYSFTVK